MADAASSPAPPPGTGVAGAPTTVLGRASLAGMPDELLLIVMGFLDVPDVLSISRTTHHLRGLAVDPLLHAHRLRGSRSRISHYLPCRPPLAALRPPSRTIYTTRVQSLARAVGRQLVCISLKRSLLRRPAAERLVAQNVLPERCYGVSGGVAPGLVGAVRSVERARVRDCLRAWIEGKRERWLVRAGGEGDDRSVRGLVRRFTAWRDASLASVSPRASRGVWNGAPPSYISGSARPGEARVERQAREEPARARVLDLRRFWEGLAKA